MTKSEDLDRQILERLTREPVPRTDVSFAEELKVARATIKSHLARLERQGLIFGRSVARLADRIAAPKAIILIKFPDRSNFVIKAKRISETHKCTIVAFVSFGETSDVVVFISCPVENEECGALMEDIQRIDERVKTVTIPFSYDMDRKSKKTSNGREEI